MEAVVLCSVLLGLMAKYSSGVYGSRCSLFGAARVYGQIFILCIPVDMYMHICVCCVHVQEGVVVL